MKLPTSETSAPSLNAGSGNGYYGQNNHTVMVILAPPSPDPAQNGDFSEYFWMENEEEFDRQVLKELEEEALMEQCMQAMIDDNSAMDSPPAQWQQEDVNPEVQNGPSSELIMAMRGLQVNGEAAQDQPKSEAKGNHEFKFNPMAKEFIPGMPFFRPSGQTSDRSPQFSELVDNQPDA
ncbi:uncharacterized protein LOC117646877 [Thrips palmi]|uniref:Uncharacterized protein LOC117646877 n=1 Tax=Thrips palmi TaxID=161013 RepID=A0A6P8ZAB2_THRPL|nr:uncharacterized protein LOC117646877 [Thrips palmi]XP_034244068.1 uncharacterized protein LOC117646877 [Thrips palmi]